MTKNLAIIPSRLGSKRLPRKNIKEFFGKPLFLYTLNSAIDSGLFDEIHVSTKSTEVVDLCEKAGMSPKFLRPESLATDDATLQMVFDYVINKYEALGYKFDNFCILWATAPFRTSKDIIDSYNMISTDVDGVIGVSNYDLPVFCAQKINSKKIISPLFPSEIRKSSKDFPKIVCDNGSLCWLKVSSFKKYKSWLAPNLLGYEMSREKSCDIDTLEDWNYAEYLYNKLEYKKNK